MTSALRPHFTKLLGLAFLFISVSLHATQPPTAPPKEALLIANGKYSHFGSLAHPLPDAARLGAVLEKIGFRVTTIQNGSREEMLDALKEFETRLQGTGAIAFFHYGGHGVQVDGRNYLIPADADIPDERRVATRAVDLDEIMGALDQANSLANVVVLDACRDNPLPALAGRTVTRGLTVVGAKPKNSIIIFAAEAGNKAVDGLFTPILSEALETPNRTIDQIMKVVRKEVYNRSQGQQTPGEYNQLFDELIFLETKSSNSSILNFSDEFSSEITSGQSSVDLSNAAFESLKPSIAKNTIQARDALLQFLAANPQSPKAVEARGVLGRINFALYRDPTATPTNPIYTVKKGDSLISIASKFKIDSERIYWANGLNSINLKIGQQLLIPEFEATLVVNRANSTVTLLNNGEFFKEYPTVSMTLLGSANPAPVETNVVDRIARKGEARVPFGHKDYGATQRLVLLGVGGATIKPVTAGDGAQPPSPAGIVLKSEDFAEIYVLVKSGTPVTIN